MGINNKIFFILQAVKKRLLSTILEYGLFRMNIKIVGPHVTFLQPMRSVAGLAVFSNLPKTPARFTETQFRGSVAQSFVGS